MKEIDLICQMTSEGAGLSDIANAIASNYGCNIDSAFRELTNRGSALAIAYHIGMLHYHGAAESALFRASEKGDVDAIELLLKNRENLRIATIRKELF